ncbi:hypothetical protein Fmac_007123 [Flemingia macrophylla]|uniref:RRM domain-containing protein n=1 Tax=Flemingia macrophylla TaxID=520843 RepID=A0ABD1NCI9_9FABA
MAKKRKLRTSDPDPDKPIEPTQEDQETAELHHPQPQPPQQQKPKPTPQNPNAMSLDELAQEEQHQQQDPEEEEEDEDEEDGLQKPETLEEDQPHTLEAANHDAEANGTEEEEENEDLTLDEEPVEKLLEPFTKEQLHSLVKQAVEKFPEFIDSICQLTDVDPTHRKIFVHGLGWDATAETLTSIFGKYGEIEDYKAVTDKVSDKSKGYAFILFKHSLVNIPAGDVAQECRQTQRLLAPPTPLLIKDVFSALQKISVQTGRGRMSRKKGIIVHLMHSCCEKEMKFLVRTLVGNLRIGAMLGTVLPVLAYAVAMNSCPTLHKEGTVANLKEKLQVHSAIVCFLPMSKFIH